MERLYEPKLIFFIDATLLEGPRWNHEKKELLVVSIEQCCIYIINMLNDSIKTILLDGQVGCAAYKNADNIIVAEYTGIYEINLNTNHKKYITQIDTNKKLRYNDGILDSSGRFLVGTTGYNCLAENQNFLYTWDGKDKKILIEGTTISNGIAFSKNDKYMYFVDSPTKKVTRYCYDINTGNIEFDKDILLIKDGGMPDGICVDTDDMLWVAQWGGSKVAKWNPYTGEKLQEIMLPCKNVSSCCVGGENNEYLFVTTAKDDETTIFEPFAGGLFKVRIRN